MKTPTTNRHRSPARLTPVRIPALLAAWLACAVATSAQVTAPSPAAQAAHATISAYEGPATCVACHQQQALEMFGSVHYQEMADTPAVPNIQGPAGKGRNGGMVMNSYCGTPVTSSRATCSTCHAGNGRIPSPDLTPEQLGNIDCLLCHQDAYKRIPAQPYQTISFPGTNGLHSIQAPIEDATGFDYVPDTAKMAVSILEAARTVHRPTRASCLRCHAGAGGSDGGKRGDISTVTANPPLSSDVHMSPQGGDLGCVNCHSAGGHRVAGRGVDLRPSDSTNVLSCASCHTDRPHGDFSATTSSSRDLHAGRVACQSCHIPSFAKDKSTEMERSWQQSHFSMAACRGQGGWIPHEVRATNVIPTYRWFDGTSLANVLGQVPLANAAGEYVLALPNGSVQSAGAKLYPMKLHRSDSARQDATGLLIPHSTFSFFTSGDFAKAVQDGQALSGLDGPASVVPVQELQTLNHGVEASVNALQCGACHAAYTAGGPARMDLKANLGYALKGPLTQICSQCHGNKSNPGFASVHNRHVTSKRLDCSSCHNFSRPERGLTQIRTIRPAAPGGPVATPASATRIDLVWADNSSTEQGFKIERSLDGTSFSPIGTVSANLTTASDTTVSAGGSYYYRVRAYNATGDSDYSLVGRATTADDATPTPPAAPTALTATATSGSQINLSWADNADNETGFAIERSADNATFSLIASVGANVTTFASTGLSAGTTYYYRVRASNGAGTSAFSNVASARTSPLATPAVVWANPAPIVYGTALGVRELNATANVPGSFVYSPPAGAVLGAGSGQVLTVQFTPNDTQTYSGASATVTLEVSRKPLSVTAHSASRGYGAANPTFTGTLSGVVNGDVIQAAFTSAATPASAVGTYPIVAGLLDPSGRLANYTVTKSDGVLSVTPAPLTIRADNQTKVAGQPNPPLTATYTGFLNGETPASLNTPVSLSTTATSSSPVGSYPIVATGAADPNYAITFVNGTLTVTSAAVTMTGLTVQPATATIAVGQTQTFTARATYSDGTSADVTGTAAWRSASPTVASITSGGQASGLAAGTSVITASLGGFNATATLTVTAGGLGTTRTFSNPGALSIPDVGPGGLHSSAISVTGLSGTISKVTVKLARLRHTNPDDLDFLLVGPAGQKVMLMSDAGGSEDASGLTLTLDDAASSALPDQSRLRSASYRPADYQSGDVFAAPAPAGPYAGSLAAFRGTNPNGNWTLFVTDDRRGSRGSLDGGWSLTVTTAATP